VGGEAGADSRCESGFNVLDVADGFTGNLVTWPEQQRIAFWTSSSTIRVVDVSAVAMGGPVASLAELSNESFGLTSDWRIQVVQYGDGLLVTASRLRQARVFSWHVGSGVNEIAVTLPPNSGPIQLADPIAGLVFVGDDQKIHRARERDGVWSLGAAIGVSTQFRSPLAFDGDDLLLGLRESNRSYDAGETGSGGEAGSAGGVSAAVERWNANDELVASYRAVGNPRVAKRARGGFLIGETNSFWGSYRAALEWLAPGNDALQTLTHVPVRSAGDGEDGAFGVAVSGDRVFVANCESGLLSGLWEGSSASLSPLWTPHAAPIGECDPTSVQVLGELLLVAGEQLTFARWCE